jgi:hypothetical protein
MTVFKIFKYPLQITGQKQSVHIEGAVKVLSLVQQGERPVMYVLVDTEKKEYTKSSIFEIRMIGTGNEVQSNTETPEDFRSYEFMSTLGFIDGSISYHFFVRRKFVEDKK